MAMLSKFSLAQLQPPLTGQRYLQFPRCKFRFSANDSAQRKFPFKNWNLEHALDPNTLQKRLNLLLSKTHRLLNEVTSPLAKAEKLEIEDVDSHEIEDIFVAEQTIESEMTNGNLSLAAIISIEQFSRMNGLTGRKMQRLFEALVPESIYNDARNLVEYCCFRLLSRDTSTIYPLLKEPAFRWLIFITMLAWENPFKEKSDLHKNASEKAYLKTLKAKRVGEEAFLRIAPAISGVADHSTVHNLFKALAGDKAGISFSVWSSYIHELLNVYEARKSYEIQEQPNLPSEQVLCVCSGTAQPVLKWQDKIALPGKLTLTDRALYFEAVGLLGQKGGMRLDITGYGACVDKRRAGSLGSMLFDSAIFVSSGVDGSEPWILEFVDLGGERKRDVWQAFINEVIALHGFLREYGPDDGDHSISHVYGAQNGKERATTSTACSIMRLQSLQHIRRLLDDPTKLVQFSYLRNAPFGDIVCQTLALNYWGGPLVRKLPETRNLPNERTRSSEEVSAVSNHVFDIDGSVYLRQWMRSPSWSSGKSVSFWRNASVQQGVILSKNLVVGDTCLVERAAMTCRDKWQLVEKTQATIDAATIEGIPSNIDLFKELVLPLTSIANNFEKLRHWEEPPLTISFLIFTYTVIFRNLLSYVFPVTLIIAASTMLFLTMLKKQGILGRSFGKVTIHDQPPSNTIQKIMALKKATRDMESYLQNLNVTLLKIRAILLSGQPQITTEVALVLLSAATVLLIIPFKYILAFVIFDLFTRELEFRREMVLRFTRFLKERWDMVPATPVIVLPFESGETGLMDQRGETNKIETSQDST